jgi:hypothetical protein
MHGASRTDRHGRRPLPAQRLQIRLVDFSVDAVAWRRPSESLAASDLLGDTIPVIAGIVPHAAPEVVVDFLVGQAGSDGDGAGDAIASLAFEASSLAAAVVIAKRSYWWFSPPFLSHDVKQRDRAWSHRSCFLIDDVL